LRYLLVTPLVLLSSLAFAGDKPASCELVGKSVESRSSSGLAQVSNLGDIQITCSTPARPYSLEGDSREVLGQIDCNTFRLKRWNATQWSPNYYGKWEADLSGYKHLSHAVRWRAFLIANRLGSRQDWKEVVVVS